MKKKNAISLIVLVITIIVMAILAAAIIITLSNTNIISEANSAVQSNDMSKIKEKVMILKAEEMFTKDGGAKKILNELKSSGLIENMEVLDGDYLKVPQNKLDKIADNEEILYIKSGDEYVEISTGNAQRGKYNGTFVSFNLACEASENKSFTTGDKASVATSKMIVYQKGQGTIEDMMNACDSYGRLKDRYSDQTSSLNVNRVSNSNKYTFTKLINSSDNISVNLNDGKPLISEHEFIFAWHNMTVYKDFFVENDSITNVYYKLYLENIQGEAADAFEVTVLDRDVTLYKGLLSNFTRENSECIGEVRIAERSTLRIEFKFIGYIEYQESN